MRHVSRNRNRIRVCDRQGAREIGFVRANPPLDSAREYGSSSVLARTNPLWLYRDGERINVRNGQRAKGGVRLRLIALQTARKNTVFPWQYRIPRTGGRIAIQREVYVDRNLLGLRDAEPNDRR